MSAVDGFLPPPHIPLSCSSLMSQGWLIWPWAATLAWQERGLPRLRAPLNWICKTKKTFMQPDRHLTAPPPPSSLFSPQLYYSIYATSYLFPWWEEIYQVAVSLTSLSDGDRNRISKCLTSLCGFIFKLPTPSFSYIGLIPYQAKGMVAAGAL